MRPDHRPSALTTLSEALTWLHEAAAELSDVPERLHERAIDGQLGPRFSGRFLHHVDDGPYATRPALRVVDCPAEHPIRRIGDPRCAMCDDTRTWTTSTDVYVRPLAAALDSLSRARSKLRPHPRLIVEALLREGCDPAAAAQRLPTFLEDDRRFLSALRALYDGFSYTAIMPSPRQVAA